MSTRRGKEPSYQIPVKHGEDTAANLGSQHEGGRRFTCSLQSESAKAGLSEPLAAAILGITAQSSAAHADPLPAWPRWARPGRMELSNEPGAR